MFNQIIKSVVQFLRIKSLTKIRKHTKQTIGERKLERETEKKEWWIRCFQWRKWPTSCGLPQHCRPMTEPPTVTTCLNWTGVHPSGPSSAFSKKPLPTPRHPPRRRRHLRILLLLLLLQLIITTKTTSKRSRWSIPSTPTPIHLKLTATTIRRRLTCGRLMSPSIPRSTRRSWRPSSISPAPPWLFRG